VCGSLTTPMRALASRASEHRDILVIADREREHAIDVLSCVVVGVLDPRDATDDVRAQLERFAHVILRPAIPHDPLLWKGNNLQCDSIGEPFTRCKERLYAHKLRFGVDIGKGANERATELDSQAKRALDIRCYPVLVVLLLDPCGELDRGHRRPHGSPLVGCERLPAGSFQGVDLVEVKVSVDKGLGDKTAIRIDHGGGLAVKRRADIDDAAARDSYRGRPTLRSAGY